MSSPGDTRTEPKYPISSVDNALRLLLMFREQRQVRLTEASGALGVAASTAHRLLAMLEHHRFVRQDPEARAYVAGSALTDVGLAVARNMKPRKVARATLESLQTITGETVHLAALEGANVRYLDCVESTNALRVASRTGRSLPAHCTSVGKAILATLSQGQLLRLYPNEDLPVSTQHSISSRSKLFTELDEVRLRGYGRNSNESEEGVGSVGVAVPVSTRSQQVGISVAAPTNRLGSIQFDRTIKALRSAVATLSEQLEAAVSVKP